MDFLVERRARAFRTSEFPTFLEHPRLEIGTIYVVSGQLLC